MAVTTLAPVPDPRSRVVGSALGDTAYLEWFVNPSADAARRTVMTELARFNPGIMIPDADDEALAIARMIYSLLLHRMDKNTGFYQLTDLDGRQWVLRASAILSFAIQPPKGRRLGFEPMAEILE
jgi:hypothetical protein